MTSSSFPYYTKPSPLKTTSGHRVNPGLDSGGGGAVLTNAHTYNANLANSKGNENDHLPNLGGLRFAKTYTLPQREERRPNGRGRRRRRRRKNNGSVYYKYSSLSSSAEARRERKRERRRKRNRWRKRNRERLQYVRR